MAYDHDLADRIRELLDPDLAHTEKAMFGGLAFLVNGNMAIAASGQGGVLVRVDPDEGDRLVARSDGVEEMVMAGRPTRGWVRVVPASVRTRRQLERWVRTGVARALDLPPKAGRSRRGAHLR